MTSTRPSAQRPTGRIDQLVRAFRRHGFAHVPGLLTAPEVARYRAAALARIARSSTFDSGIGLESSTDAWERDETLRQLALDPWLGEFAERLSGVPMRVTSCEVLVKPPHVRLGQGPTLHDDLTFQAPGIRFSFNVWVALADVPVERGALTFLPGSHRRTGPERVDGRNADDLEYDETGTYLFTYWPALRWAPRVTVPLRAGDATVHHSRTAHQGGVNTTDEPRISMLMTFVDAEADYQSWCTGSV